MHDFVVDLSAVAVCGALGGFVNVFIGDSGLHLPEIQDGIFRPGYIGVVFVGTAAALGAWLATQGGSFVDSLHNSAGVTLRLSELSTAIVVGFGGARWFKSEGETTVLRKTAAIAAGRSSDVAAAAAIASSSAFEALAAAKKMPE
jgi:hypothetical protein